MFSYDIEKEKKANKPIDIQNAEEQKSAFISS